MEWLELESRSKTKVLGWRAGEMALLGPITCALRSTMVYDVLSASHQTSGEDALFSMWDCVQYFASHAFGVGDSDLRAIDLVRGSKDNPLV